MFKLVYSTKHCLTQKTRDRTQKTQSKTNKVRLNTSSQYSSLLPKSRWVKRWNASCNGIWEVASLDDRSSCGRRYRIADLLLWRFFAVLYRNESDSLGFTFLCPKWVASDVKTNCLSFGVRYTESSCFDIQGPKSTFQCPIAKTFLCRWNICAI